MDDTVTLEQLKARIKDFNLKRNWDKAHKPKDLILALIEEIGELASLFKWKKDIKDINKQEVTNELADIFIYLLIFSYKLDIDVSDAIEKKLRINERKYPLTASIKDDKIDGKVILLTGIPATGKTTLTKLIKSSIEPIECFDYGQLIINFKKDTLNIEYDELREKSSFLVHPNDIKNIDTWLVNKIKNLRNKTNIIIDSHAVTREKYGYRLIPFSFDLLNKLSFDAVIILHSDFTVLNERIKIKAEGRGIYTTDNFYRHLYLQDSLAELYGVVCGCPTYIVDNNNSVENTKSVLLSIFDEIGMDYTVKDGGV